MPSEENEKSARVGLASCRLGLDWDVKVEKKAKTKNALFIKAHLINRVRYVSYLF
tara:strand:+ start:485 stop:649 length:165 start_codon:yes stop_codon:yes gene_type:complete